MAKLCLLQGWSQGGWPTHYLGGGGGRNAYHKNLKKLLNLKNKTHASAFTVVLSPLSFIADHD